MTADQIIALVAVGVPFVGTAAAFGWRLSARLASIDTIISREMSHNGGSSTKDYARAGRDEAKAARDQAVLAKHLAESVDAKVDQLTKNQGAIERKLRQVSDVVVGMQAVQTYRETIASPPGATVSSSSTTTTHTTTEGAP